MPYRDPRELEKIRTMADKAMATAGGQPSFVSPKPEARTNVRLPKPGMFSYGGSPEQVGAAARQGLNRTIESGTGNAKAAVAATGAALAAGTEPTRGLARGFFGGASSEKPTVVDPRTAGGEGPAVTPAEAGLAERGGVKTVSRPGQPPAGKMDYTAPAKDVEGTFRTDVAQDGQKEYGKAIYSDSVAGATRQGLDAAIKQGGTAAGGKRDFYAGVDVSGMSDDQYAKFKIAKMQEAQGIYDSVGKSVPSGQGGTGGSGERRDAQGNKFFTGPGAGITIAGNSRVDEYNDFRRRNAASDIPSNLSPGRKAKLMLAARELEANTALGQERNRIADFAARSEDARGRAATASDLLSTQYDTQVDAANLANQQAKTAISGQDLIRKRQEFAAGAPTRQLATFDAINAGADLASETLNDTPLLKETKTDAGGLYKQIAARVGDPAQANVLLQGFLTSVQERDKMARDAGKKPLDAEVLNLELEDFLSNL